jgi:energy-coupling factor transporter ATP-binding protein EcfA2
MMPMQFNTVERIHKKRARAKELLELTNISKRAGHRLSQLSGGEQQRVAIALALANNPKLLLADEPTGSVDSRTSEYILDMFRTITKTTGTTVVIVTHDRQISKKVERVVAIRDGKTSSELIMKQSYAAQMAGLHGFGGGAGDAEQQEFAVLDRAGRLQIPREYLDRMGLNDNKVAMSMDENGRIVLKAPEAAMASDE